MLTQERLKELLNYDPETGVFVWNVAANGSIKLGQRAGCVGSAGYRQIKIDKKIYLEHRLVWFYVHDCWPTNQLDHINRVKDDNRLCNLRAVSHQENMWNTTKQKINKSGYAGVSWKAKIGKWVAQIGLNGTRRHIGYFDTKEEAHAAYVRAKEELHKIGEQQ